MNIIFFFNNQPPSPKVFTVPVKSVSVCDKKKKKNLISLFVSSDVCSSALLTDTSVNKLQTARRRRNSGPEGWTRWGCAPGRGRWGLWFAWTIVLHKFGCFFFFWPGPFWPFTSTLAGCGGAWMVSARGRHKGAFVPPLHHIHHVMPVRQIWLDVSVTLMWVQSASGPEMANFTLYCLFCSIDIGVEAGGGEERRLRGRRRREKGEQAGGSPHYFEEQIHNKFPHSTKPGRDDWHYFTPTWTKGLIWAEYQMNGSSVDSIQTILISPHPPLPPPASPSHLPSLSSAPALLPLLSGVFSFYRVILLQRMC